MSEEKIETKINVESHLYRLLQIRVTGALRWPLKYKLFARIIVQN